MSNESDAIAARTQQCISDSAMSQKQVAKHLAITASQLSKSLNGTRQFSAVELAQLAALLDVSMHWLVTGKSDPNEFTLAARHSFNQEDKSYSADSIDADAQLLADIALIYRQAYA